MKKVTLLSKRFRVSLALFTALALLPLGSSLQSAQAKPKSGAPAYGYRAKNKKQKYSKRRNYDRDYRRNNDRDDRNDDRYERDDRNDDDRYENRRYRTRYRTRTNSNGDRVREYFRSYFN